MKKTLLFLSFLTFISTPSYAEEDFEYVVEAGENYNFSKPSIPMPTCSDGRVLTLTKNTMAAYQERNPAITVSGKRKQKLILKNLQTLEDISPDNVTSKYDINLANELVSLKINENITSLDLVVCRGPEILGNSNMYVILYQKNGVIIGKIINFAEPGKSERDLEFIY